MKVVLLKKLKELGLESITNECVHKTLYNAHKKNKVVINYVAYYEKVCSSCTGYDINRGCYYNKKNGK